MQPQSVTLERARRIFDHAGPPVDVWERQFDYMQEELVRLAQTPLEQIDPTDLWYYFHDLCYVELQPELFAYLFPACLWDWHQTLLANEPCQHGDAEFHRGLVHGQALEKLLSPTQRQAVDAFLRDSFLERLQRERGLDNALFRSQWIARFNSLALVSAEIGELWTQWWQVTSRGHAVTAIVYISDLIYTTDENPLLTNVGDSACAGHLTDIGWHFPPLLASDDSLECAAGWLPPNLEFVRTRVTPEFVATTLSRAVERLRGEPEQHLALHILSDFNARDEIVRSRIRELPELLSLPKSKRVWKTI